MKHLGAWDRISTERMRPYQDMQVWDGISDARITFGVADIASPQSANEDTAIAWIIENLNLQRSILAKLDEYRSEGAKVEIFESRRVEAIELPEAVESEFPDEDWR